VINGRGLKKCPGVCYSGLPLVGNPKAPQRLPPAALARWVSFAGTLPPFVHMVSGDKFTVFDLLALDRFKQRLEVAFAKPVIAFALNKLEKDRPDHGF